MARPSTKHMSLAEFRQYVADAAIRRSESALAEAFAAEKRAIRAEILGPSAPRAPREPLPTEIPEYVRVLQGRVQVAADRAARSAARKRVKGSVLTADEIKAIFDARVAPVTAAARYQSAARDRLHTAIGETAIVVETAPSVETETAPSVETVNGIGGTISL